MSAGNPQGVNTGTVHPLTPSSLIISHLVRNILQPIIPGWLLSQVIVQSFHGAGGGVQNNYWQNGMIKHRDNHTRTNAHNRGGALQWTKQPRYRSFALRDRVIAKDAAGDELRGAVARLDAGVHVPVCVLKTNKLRGSHSARGGCGGRGAGGEVSVGMVQMSRTNARETIRDRWT